MAFFKKWKIQNKHKKLSEEWALATSLKDLSETIEPDETDETDDNLNNSSTFNLKFLGSTSIESERSQDATAGAIKSVISTAKSIRKKKSQRVKLIVSAHGIEVIDITSGDSLLKISIYKISYCSADAAHDHVFAFIGSENNTKNDADDDGGGDELLSCYVFMCPKRRIAHDVTLTVARCFENAYQNWRNSVEKKMYQDEIRNRCNTTKKNIIIEEKSSKEVGSIRDLLIDLTPEFSSEIYAKDTRNYLQNTWVSFEDDFKEERPLPITWEQQQLVF